MKIINPILWHKIFQRRQVWTLSNAISLGRLFLGLYIYHLIRTHQLTLLLGVALVAIASDFLDGFIARRRNEISELGKVLDPLADKVSIALASLALWQDYGLPGWIVLLIIGRDALIMVGALLLMNRLKFVVASEWPGKIAVTIMSALLLSYLFHLEIFQYPLQIITVFFIAFSGLYYGFKFFQLLRKPIPEEDSVV